MTRNRLPFRPLIQRRISFSHPLFPNRHLPTLVRRALGCLCFSLAWVALPSVAKAADYLAAEPMEGRKVRVDGMLREWPQNMAQLKLLKGSGATGRALVGYDDRYVYVAAELTDRNIVRTRSGGSGEDRLTLDLYVPSPTGRGGKTHTVSFYPGDPGKLAGVVKIDGQSAPGSKAVEQDTGKKLLLEGQIPWSAIPGADRVRVGLRGKLSYHDARSVGSIQSVASTSPKSGSTMPYLTLEAETGLLEALVLKKGLSVEPARAVYGDVTGTGGAERVALYGHFLSIVGPGYKGGKQFYFNELDVGSAKRVKRLELHDFDGDGAQEIILAKHIGPDDEYREVLQILRIGPDGAPEQVFAHEVSIVTPEGRVENEVEIAGSGKSSTVTISQGTADGFEPGSFREPSIGGGIESALLPWETTGAKVYGWKGNGLALLEKKSWDPAVSGGATAARDPAKPAPPAPRPPTAGELLDRVYALYKKDRGVGSKKPRFDFVTDVVEDRQMERVLVHGKDLVVFGQGFKKGLSYTYLTIGVKKPEDVLSVTTRDLVGDGKAEILVHGVIDAQASEELGGEIVQRQALFVYKVVGENLARIFAAETGRSLGENRVLGSVAFVPSGDSVELELHPLRALGWTQRTYPFPEDTMPAGGLEPLLLPWGTVTTRRYVFDGSSYVQR